MYFLLALSALLPSLRHSELQFLVSQDANGANSIDTLVSFTGIPSGSYECQLAMEFTYEYNITNVLAVPGEPLINVYAISSSAHNISVSDTYFTYFPDGGSGLPDFPGSYLFGSTHITGLQAVINS
ncbi:MAG: hypothetical protein MMC33_006180 [Icmadophila ericetorum]|nr:hypothetical protein [Icmadophila ericetorum]